MKKIIQKIDKLASDLEEKGFMEEAEALDIISNTIEAVSGKIQQDIVEEGGKIFYHPLKRILKPFPQLLKAGKFEPSGIGPEAADIPGIDDTMSFEFKAPNGVKMEIFVAAPDEFRIGKNPASEGHELNEKELIDAIKTTRLF